MKSIKFTEDHIQKIKSGEKKSTLRTVKKDNLYHKDRLVKIADTDHKIHIKKRKLVLLKQSGIYRFDSGKKADKQKIAEYEGFNSFEDLLHWFISRNYNLPQPMFLYIFEKPDGVETSLGEFP